MTRLRVVSADPSVLHGVLIASRCSASELLDVHQSTKDHPAGGEATSPSSSVRSPWRGPQPGRPTTSKRVEASPWRSVRSSTSSSGSPATSSTARSPPSSASSSRAARSASSTSCSSQGRRRQRRGDRVRGPRRRRLVQRPRGRGRRVHQRGGHRVRRRRARTELVGGAADLEDVWATPFVEAMRNSGGVLIEGSRIPHDLIEAAEAELAAAG